MFTLNCKGRLLVIDKPIVMGIINATPDSFYGDSRQQNTDAVLKKAEQMLKEGATILDIGGQSTRPGSEKLTAEDELKRVIASIKAIQTNFPEAFISIDTYYSLVAKEAVAVGASIVNDVSAGSMDAEMISTVASLNVPYVLMHMQGTPQTMQQEPVYENVNREILDLFIQKTNELKKLGIKDIIIDPGFGFGKTIQQNFELLRNLSVFKMLNSPILLGISRKSFIYKTLNISVEDSLNGTTALHSTGLLNGASILRVHDVKEAVETINLISAYQHH
ncbi:MAG: dihydropteroate synthase [Chitinophagaceae bacterium]|nr:dihydropteroate synthase [Chitinophagaceae bacterium]MBK8311601.1 dihydropteroate synthase [Chitinophagaceae bacterium]MBK8605712.1 dihydropteroate synthase [Chitinophagaceae bacterium]MBP6477345.1 dihydropteroate synthase [Chitinophagaceae bacterium]MBP7107547.1 dihydropteroate synthase [Chitinophagaceae bacterium]